MAAQRTKVKCVIVLANVIVEIAYWWSEVEVGLIIMFSAFSPFSSFILTVFLRQNLLPKHLSTRRNECFVNLFGRGLPKPVTEIYEAFLVLRVYFC